MLTVDDLQKLASRRERAEKTVLTLYLDVDQSKQANLNRGFEKQLKDMLADVKETIRDDGELKAFEIASQRAEDFVTRYHVGARGLALVFDASDGFFWSEPPAYREGHGLDARTTWHRPHHSCRFARNHH